MYRTWMNKPEHEYTPFLHTTPPLRPHNAFNKDEHTPPYHEQHLIPAWPVTMKCKWHDERQKLWNSECFLHCWLHCGTTLWNYIVGLHCGTTCRPHCRLHCGTTCRPHVRYAVSYGMCDAVKQGLDAPKRVCVFQPAVPSYVNNFIPEYTGQVQRMIKSTCDVYCNTMFQPAVPSYVNNFI